MAYEDANQRRAVVIQHTSKGWMASFWGFEGMPSGEPLPLPFTSMSTESAIRAHINANFPGASVRAVHSV